MHMVIEAIQNKKNEHPKLNPNKREELPKQYVTRANLNDTEQVEQLEQPDPEPTAYS